MRNRATRRSACLVGTLESSARHENPTVAPSLQGSSRRGGAPSATTPPRDLLGAHTSIAGGTPNAPPRARAIGATAMQIFTKQANRWAERECVDDECRAFAAALGETFVNATAAHDSYLINLASPDPMLRARSLESFVAELGRAERLAVDYLVSHPGNYIDSRDSGISRDAEAISIALERVSGRAMLLMELTAGSGTSLGSRFEDMAALLDAISTAHRPRVAVCLDTAHVWASGYDLANDYEGVWSRFADVIGMERLRLLHLNDSKVALGSRRDRHELIGEGAIGELAFRRIMNDPRFAAVPKVIETPKLGEAEKTDRLMLERLRSYVE